MNIGESMNFTSNVELKEFQRFSRKSIASDSDYTILIQCIMTNVLLNEISKFIPIALPCNAFGVLINSNKFQLQLDDVEGI